MHSVGDTLKLQWPLLRSVWCRLADGVLLSKLLNLHRKGSELRSLALSPSPISKRARGPFLLLPALLTSFATAPQENLERPAPLPLYTTTPPAMPSLLLSSQAFLSTSALSSRRVPSRHRHCTARGAGGAGVAVTTALFTKKKGDTEKAQTKTKTPSSRGRNLISPKPLYAAGAVQHRAAVLVAWMTRPLLTYVPTRTRSRLPRPRALGCPYYFPPCSDVPALFTSYTHTTHTACWPTFQATSLGTSIPKLARRRPTCSSPRLWRRSCSSA